MSSTLYASADSPRLLIIGAHPDDAEYHAGGLASIYRQLGRCVKLVSVTDGGAGHFRRSADELITARREESVAAGKIIGAEYESLGFSDGQLVPSVEVRHSIIREMREFRPDLVLTHRTCDYHPDHRATGQAVQDASYLVTVPLVLPEFPPLYRAPVFAYMTDLFTRPTRLRVDVALEVESQMDKIVRMLACHHTQVFEWLPYHADTLETIPDRAEDRVKWLQDWYSDRAIQKSDHFREELQTIFGNDVGGSIRFVELFEISEYGSPANQSRLRDLFPGASFPGVQ
jgi:LmbE family N-acetylglucosaminyl deacetylase